MKKIVLLILAPLCFINAHSIEKIPAETNYLLAYDIYSWPEIEFDTKWAEVIDKDAYIQNLKLHRQDLKNKWDTRTLTLRQMQMQEEKAKECETASKALSWLVGLSVITISLLQTAVELFFIHEPNIKAGNFRQAFPYTVLFAIGCNGMMREIFKLEKKRKKCQQEADAAPAYEKNLLALGHCNEFALNHIQGQDHEKTSKKYSLLFRI